MARTDSSDALSDRETLTAPSVINPIDSYVPSSQRVAIVMATFNGGRFVEMCNEHGMLEPSVCLLQKTYP